MKRTLLGLLPLFTAVSLYAADEERCIEVTLNAPGQLGQVLGERIHEVDSLVVTGPMDSRDFQFIKTAYDKGNASAGIRVINIEGAEVEDNVLPLGAFSGISYRLERVMLPDNIIEFKKDVFAGCSARKVNIPSALRTIKLCAFDGSDIAGAVELPEGVTEIPNGCFRMCLNLTEVKLPSTVTAIADRAFEKSPMLASVNLPDGLESMGAGAFTDCDALSGIEIPAGVRIIEGGAFLQARNLSRVTFKGESVDRIGTSAFESTAIETLVLPVSVGELAERSFFNIPTLKAIYSPSAVPPVAQAIRVNGRAPEYFAFGGTTPSDVTVYVPVGSVELYRSCWGWDYFSNFVETTEWPGESGIESIVADGGDVAFTVADGQLVVTGVPDGSVVTVYDLAGRCVKTSVINGNAISLDTLAGGVYIVTTAGKSGKVRV